MKKIKETFLVLLIVFSCIGCIYAIAFYLEPYISIFGSSLLGYFVGLFLLITIGESDKVNRFVFGKKN